MTTHGHCPKCNSTYYIPDPRIGGAGRNECRNCGHIGPVRDFHLDIPLSVKTREPSNFNALELLPEGVELDKKTGNLKASKPAAPIRQYKDE